MDMTNGFTLNELKNMFTQMDEEQRVERETEKEIADTLNKDGKIVEIIRVEKKVVENTQQEETPKNSEPVPESVPQANQPTQENTSSAAEEKIKGKYFNQNSVFFAFTRVLRYWEKSDEQVLNAKVPFREVQSQIEKLGMFRYENTFGKPADSNAKNAHRLMFELEKAGLAKVEVTEKNVKQLVLTEKGLQQIRNPKRK